MEVRSQRPKSPHLHRSFRPYSFATRRNPARRAGLGSIAPLALLLVCCLSTGPVKLEGYRNILRQVEAISQAGILIMPLNEVSSIIPGERGESGTSRCVMEWSVKRVTEWIPPFGSDLTLILVMMCSDRVQPILSDFRHTGGRGVEQIGIKVGGFYPTGPMIHKHYR